MLLPSTLGFSPHPPVSVFGTGTFSLIAAFLGTDLLLFATSSSLHLAVPVFPFPGSDNLLCVPTFLAACSAGISTCCPSTTPLGLALGPDFPRADQLYPGNLRFSAWRIPTSISLLIPAFSLHNSPRLLTVPLLRVINAPLPTYLTVHSIASVLCFSPGHFRRRTSRLVSYYALFE